MSQPTLYLLSLRNLSPYPAQGCILDLEDVFSEISGAKILAPASDLDIAEVLKDVPHQSADLFITAISSGDVIRILKGMNGRGKIFRKIYTYIFDAFLSPDQPKGRGLLKQFSRTTRAVSQIDHMFITLRPAVEEFGIHYGVPVSYVPMAADVVKFGTAQSKRCIDVNAYGRQNVSHVHALADLYNTKDSGRSLHYTSHVSFTRVNDLYRHRAFFWKVLSMSRIALAYDPSRVNPDRRHFPFAYVAQRWFESLAAGCVVAGYRPVCSDADQLLHWEDATIECPENPGEFVEFIESLLEDADRLNRVRLNNCFHMALSHDWCYRIEDMFKFLGLELDPHALARRREMLARMAREITPQLGIAAHETK